MATNPAVEGGAAPSPVPMSPAADLYAFAADRPRWQAELIRRIYETGQASEQDVTDGIAMLRQSEGLDAPGAPVPEPLKPFGPQGALADPSVRLVSVGGLESVNRLRVGSPLGFAESGLTVVYGENATGKSGYCRVIKAACGGASVVLPDVFVAQTAVPRATLTYSVDGNTEAFVWTPGTMPPDALSKVTVFDAIRAPLYVDEERRLGFLPRGLEVLPALGRVLTTMASRLGSDVQVAEAGTPVIGIHAAIGTRVGQLLDRLAPDRRLPTDAEIDAIGPLTVGEGADLEQLESSFGRDPAAAAGRLEAAAARLRSLNASFDLARGAVSPDAAQTLIQLVGERDEARVAVELAGRVALDGVTVLPAAGSEPWRLMFEYARSFMAIAAPDRPFPDDADDALCPLCQQPLGPEAKDRFRHFAEFVSAAAQAHLAHVSTRLEGIRQEIQRVSIPTALDVSALGLVDPEDAPGLAAIAVALDTLRGHLELRRVAMASYEAGVQHDLLEQPTPVPALLHLATELEARAVGFRAASRDETRPGLLARLEELRAIDSFDRERQSVRRLRTHLGMVAALRRCRAACDTTAISRRNSDLRDRYLTAEFESNFREELTRLGLENLAVRPAGRTERGENLISIALDSAMRVRIREVLSDGEIRAVGLAGFFADCRRIGANPPIVLDDPVSSLDHQRIRAVAHRIVDEARHRQVIVFTHSILLLWEIWERATAQEVPVTPHWLRVEGGIPGSVTANTVPWEADSVRTRLGRLGEKLAAARRIGDLSGEDYRGAVRLFYGDLRDTWERLVEDLLFNGVIGRFTPGVQSLRLRKVEVTDADFRVIDSNMTRTSLFEHSQAPGREQTLPRPAEMETDLDALRDFSEAIRARLEVVDRRRRDAQRPPTATVAPGA